MPTQSDNVKYSKPSHELLRFKFVASWKFLRDVVREKHFFLVHDDDLPKDFMFSPRFIASDYGYVWSNVLVSLTGWLAKIPRIYACDFRRLLHTSMGFLFPWPRINARQLYKGPRNDGTNPMDLEEWLEFQPQRFGCWDSTTSLTTQSLGLRRRPPAAQRRRPQRGCARSARRHLPLRPRGGRL
jgi:hypothetical protein